MRATRQDHELAAELVGETGRLLIELRHGLEAKGAPATVLRVEGDRQAHDLLMSRLRDACPTDAILSEEGKDDTIRLSADRTWVIDPLDGTREFSEPPRTDWAVHVALVIDNQPIVGAVALPALELVRSTAQPAALDSNPPTRPRLVVSRTRPPAAAAPVADALGALLIEMGSAGAKAMAVVGGDAEIYIHSGGQYEWDSCAPVAVAAGAGCHVSRLDGSRLLYNQPDPYLPDLVICRPELAERVLEALRTSQG